MKYDINVTLLKMDKEKFGMKPLAIVDVKRRMNFVPQDSDMTIKINASKYSDAQLKLYGST